MPSCAISDNVIELHQDGGRWAFCGGRLHGTVPAYSGDTVRLRVRNEDIRLVSDPADLAVREMGLSGGTVVDVSFLGRTRSVVTEFGETKLTAMVIDSDNLPRRGESVVVAFTPQSALSYGADGELHNPPTDTRSNSTGITAGARTSDTPSATSSDA